MLQEYIYILHVYFHIMQQFLFIATHERWEVLSANKLKGQEKLIQSLLNDGCSQHEIAKILGVNVSSISRQIKKHGLIQPPSYSTKPIEKIVEELIAKYNLNPPVDLIKICSQIGIKVKEVDFENDLSGMLTNNTIYINEGLHPNRKRFTIAHELGHYLIHKKQDNSYKGIRFRSTYISSKEKKEEREANTFASQLLIPTNFVKKDLEDSSEISEDKIIKLSKKYEVSVIAMTIRLEKLGFCYSWDNV